MIVSPPGQKFGYFRPSIAELFVSLNDNKVFMLSPFVLLDIGIKMVVPSNNTELEHLI